MNDAWPAPPAPAGDPGQAWGDWHDEALAGPATPWHARLRVNVVPHARIAGGLAVLLVLTGAPVGLLWAALTPPVPVLEEAGRLSYANLEGKAFFAADGWFFLLSLALGLVTGAGVWRALRSRGPAVPVGIAAGSLLAALVARAVGEMVVIDQRVADYCGRVGGGCDLYDGTPHVRATGVLLVWALTALIVFLLLTAFLDPDRHARPVPPPPSEWWVPVPDPRAAEDPSGGYWSQGERRRTDDEEPAATG